MSCVSFFDFVLKSLIGAKAICWPLPAVAVTTA